MSLVFTVPSFLGSGISFSVLTKRLAARLNELHENARPKTAGA
jgi:hypothetical protein